MNRLTLFALQFFVFFIIRVIYLVWRDSGNARMTHRARAACRTTLVMSFKCCDFKSRRKSPQFYLLTLHITFPSEECVFKAYFSVFSVHFPQKFLPSW